MKSSQHMKKKSKSLKGNAKLTQKKSQRKEGFNKQSTRQIWGEK